jgi:hypothetical protein
VSNDTIDARTRAGVLSFPTEGSGFVRMIDRPTNAICPWRSEQQSLDSFAVRWVVISCQHHTLTEIFCHSKTNLVEGGQSQ